MTELEILRATRALIARKEDWFGGDSVCRTTDGSQNCIWTAKGRVVFDRHISGSEADRSSLSKFKEHIGGGSIFEFNDTHTHAEVLAAVDAVIAKMEEQTYGAELPPLPVEMEQAVA